MTTSGNRKETILESNFASTLKQNPVLIVLTLVVVAFASGASAWLIVDDRIDRGIRNSDFITSSDLESVKFRMVNCNPSAFVNKFDQPVNFQCPSQQVLIGTSSIHQNGVEDRRFAFTCCTLELSR